jgi:protease-4
VVVPREVAVKKLLVGILAMLGLLTILAVVAVAGLVFLSAVGKPGVPRAAILELDLTQGVLEIVPDDPVARILLDERLELRDVVDALDRASTDRRIKGLVARVGGVGMGIAHIQEIRDAVERFRAAGKPAVVYAETFGEFGPGNGSYYLATAFDEIYLQPTGDVGLTGLMYEMMFINGTLEKLDVIPRMDARHEYKSAVSYYTERRLSEPHREALKGVMDSHFEQILLGIAEARALSEEEVRGLVDRGPFSGAEALEAGLVDGLAYRDEVYETLRQRSDSGTRFLYLSAYLERAGRPHSKGTTIALVHGYGTILRGSSSFSPLDGTVIMGSDSVTSAFRAAIKDRRVEAIIFRVDSPGGSPAASDAIWRQTVVGREADKPIVVSMGNMAGSGGYMVSMSADKIVAQPGTVTGSIGVLGGKLVTRGFWDKLGVSFDDVQTSANSPMWSTHYDFDAAENDRFQALLDEWYEDFTRKVAEGRDLPLDEVLEVARGRIWTGAEARELGLVDELGGYETALRLAREELGLDPDAPVRIKRFPARRSTFDLLFGERPDSSEGVAVAALGSILAALQPKVRMLQRLGLESEASVLVRMQEAPALN